MIYQIVKYLRKNSQNRQRRSSKSYNNRQKKLTNKMKGFKNKNYGVHIFFLFIVIIYLYYLFPFYLKLQSFRLIMGNNFIQMAAWAGHAVAYTIGPIFKYIVDCVQLYFTNGFTNIVL